MKRAASILAGLLLAAGCAKSEPVEPPAEFADAVRALVDGATLGAKTCGAVLDADPGSKVFAWADATLPTDGVAALRERAIGAGWQPTASATYALALVGPDNRRLAVTGQGVVRVESNRCSTSPGDTLPDEDFALPELSGAQRTTVLASFTEAVGLAQRLGAAAGARLAPDTFPADTTEVPRSWLSICQDGPRAGVRLAADTTQSLDTTTDVPAAHERLTAAAGGWAVTPKIAGQRSWVDATTQVGGQTLKVSSFLDKRTSSGGETTVEFALRVDLAGCVLPG